VYSTAVLLGSGRGDYRTIGINFGVVMAVVFADSANFGFFIDRPTDKVTNGSCLPDLKIYIYIGTGDV
jgi:hypothetical protein